jgi:hypothetical protein
VYSGHMVHTSFRASGAVADPRGAALTGGRQLIAVERPAKTAYYIGQMTYQEGR